MWEHRFGSTYSALNQKSDEAFFQNINCTHNLYVTSHQTKAWQRSQVGSQTAEHSDRERWARRTLRKSPKREHWHQQTVTGESNGFNGSNTFNSHMRLSKFKGFPLCVRQVSLGIWWDGPGRPAALFIQFGGWAREGGAASREPASCQRICPPHILRRRCPGPKVKTIHPCTSLTTHSCTVTIILWFWSVFILFFSFYFVFFFLYIYPFVLTLPIHRARWVLWELDDVNVCVFVFTRSPSASVHWVFVFSRSK